MYTAHTLGADEGALNMREKRGRYIREANSKYVRPIVDPKWRYPNDNFDRHTYEKGAAVLHMLRDLIGDEAFFKANKLYLEKYRFANASSDDFLKIVNEVSGQDFGWFSKQWLFSPGHPVLDVSHDWNAETKKLTVNVVQRQSEKGGVPVFRLPVRIAIVTPGGRRVENVWIEDRKASFEFECGEAPLMVRFDEGDVLLKQWRHAKSTEELVYQAQHDDAMGRMWAVENVRPLMNEPSVAETLADRAQNDRFWGVRRAAVEGLGRLRVADHATVLRRVAEDREARVRAAAYEALGRDLNGAYVGFLKQRFEKDESDAARAAAVRAVGRSGGENARAFLVEAAKLKSHRDVIGQAARDALKKLRK
jgi:aminopeptidase N